MTVSVQHDVDARRLRHHRMGIGMTSILLLTQMGIHDDVVGTCLSRLVSGTLHRYRDILEL